MSAAKIIFDLNDIKVSIQCSQEDKIKDICQKYATKIKSNINSLLFLYGGNQINMELKFKEQANLIDINNKEMNVLVYKKGNDDFICPHCNKKIKLNTENIDDIILINNNIKDIINGIKFTIDNIIKLSINNNISFQLKNINIILDTINENMNKNNEKLKNLLNENNEVINNKLNEINNSIKEIKYDNGRYVGQIVNGKKEGKGIYYWTDGDRYEGDFKNDKKEGKGIEYYNDGARYEGDWKNYKREGKGIYYYNNGDREMGDYYNNQRIGKHVILTNAGEVQINNY